MMMINQENSQETVIASTRERPMQDADVLSLPEEVD